MRRAGALVAAGRASAGDDVTTKSTPTDVVTAMDRAAERLVVDSLRSLRPGDGVLGEESGETRGSTGVRWVLDPIDGTVNYLYDLPAYAVSLAAEVDGVPTVGAVYNPAIDELWTAIRGEGAWLGERRLRGSQVGSLDQALVATGFGYATDRRRAQAEVVAELLPEIRDIRRFGAASLDLCSAAAGRVDAYFERGLKPWDLAAGALIATEAGLLVTGLRGRPAGEDLVLAAPPALHAALHDRLVGLRADEGP
ncbi:MAG: inositol monophosphatase [Actinomycetota bacterium]|nr:inositol monophosphatase [Actinomycetota bacterium]